MAIFAIPNPKKSTIVDFPVDRIKISVKNIPFKNKKYKFTSSNEIFHQYTFEALERFAATRRAGLLPQNLI